MRTISSALNTHLSSSTIKLATCWRVVLSNGVAYAFTDHDQDIIIAGWAGRDAPLNATYLAATGFTATDIQTADNLSVANLEVSGMLTSPSITEADLRAGLWDYARVTIFRVNWSDVSMGPIYQRTGHIGEVTTGINAFRAEIRGLTQAYTRTICEIASPACRANFGDARCKVVLATYTVAGAVTAVNAASPQTFYDTSLTQPGPAAGVAITGITNANPCVITMANGSLNLAEGQPVTLSGIVGMPKLNQVTVAYGPSGNTFHLHLDTTDTSAYGVYVSGGLVTPYGGSSGYFDFGLVTWLTGANAGLAAMEVKAYVPGQVTLQLPPPYPIVIGDTYSIHAGCDKLLATCRDRFNNLLNMRAEPYLPGMDRMIQVGRSK